MVAIVWPLRKDHQHMGRRIAATTSTSFLFAYIILLAGNVLAGKAQTLRYPIPPCHLLPAYTSGGTECFDDVDRNGKFSYDRGDRAWTLKLWRKSQLNSTY
jgi:hypothetical protein